MELKFIIKIYINFHIILFVFRSVDFFADATANPTSGPYKTLLIRAERCENTTYPLEPDPPFTLNLEAYNSTKRSFRVRGNVTVTRENRHVKIKMKTFIWRNGKWKLTYFINNIGCHGTLLHMVTTALGLKYNRETCGFVKGNYVFVNINPDTIMHIWASKLEYGRLLWISETMALSTTYNCWEFETLTAPLDNK